MKMRINPILRKELKMNARTVKLPILVILYNLVLSCVAILSLAGVRSQYDIGYAIQYDELFTIFYILGWIQCVIVCFMIPVLTASSIAGEREKQTLDIMLTTSIRPFKIIVGKLTASMCTVCLLVISSIPILSVAFIFGGMDWSYILYFILIVISIGILVGSVGIFFSSLVKKTPVAIVLTFILGGIVVLGTVYGFPLIREFYQEFHYDSITGVNRQLDIRWSALLMLMNPAVLFFDFMQKSSGSPGISHYIPDLFHCASNGRMYTFAENWWIPASVIVQLGIAFLFLWGATWALDPLKHKNGHRRKKKKK